MVKPGTQGKNPQAQEPLYKADQSMKFILTGQTDLASSMIIAEWCLRPTGTLKLQG